MRPRIFVTQPIAESALKRLTGLADVNVNPDSSRIASKDLIINGVRQSDILFSLLHDHIDRDILSANPSLRGVTSMCITPDNIDVEAATALGIPVTVVPAMAVESTADLTFALILAVARRLIEGDRMLRAGGYPGSQSAHLLGKDVSGKTLGLVGGKGRIGQAVARRARGFDMRVLYWGPRRLPADQEQASGMIYVPFNQLCAKSDFVSIHAAMRSETHHLIDAAAIKLMKPTAIVINTARGPILDEAALAKALSEGRIAGAGLDVFEHEPDVHPDLLARRDVVLVPHLGSAAHDVRDTMANAVVDNIVALLEGDVPPNCINPTVFSS